MKFPYFLLALTLVTAARAATLHDNGVPLFSDVERSDFDNGKQIGDRISVTTPETLQGVQWWGAYLFSNVPTADLFTAQIFAMVNGVPETTPLLQYSLTGVTRQNTGGAIEGYSIYAYTAPLPDVMLAPGNYVFSIMNNTAATSGTSWFWADGTVTTDNAWERDGPTLAWYSGRGGLPPSPTPSVAFNLTGIYTVPEPSSVLLLGTIAAGLALRRNRAARR